MTLPTKKTEENKKIQQEKKVILQKKIQEFSANFKDFLINSKKLFFNPTFQKLTRSRLTYNLFAQIFTFSLICIAFLTATYIFYNIPPTAKVFKIMMTLIFLGIFGSICMIYFLIENVGRKKILSVWSTNLILMKSMVLTLFLNVGYFLYVAGFLSPFSVLFLCLFFAIYLKWLSTIGK